MGFTPTYKESHLVVAAARILEHQTGRSPLPEEIADLLGFNREKVNILVHELEKRKVLRLLKSPFDVRVDVADPAPLEALPQTDAGPAVKAELDEFTAKAREKKKEMEKMLRGGEAEKRRKARVAKLEEQFKSFQPKKGELEGLFGPTAADEDEDE